MKYGIDVGHKWMAVSTIAVGGYYPDSPIAKYLGQIGFTMIQTVYQIHEKLSQSGTLWYLRIIFSNVIIFGNERYKNGNDWGDTFQNW